jgi:hypothetical protein
LAFFYMFPMSQIYDSLATTLTCPLLHYLNPEREL